MGQVIVTAGATLLALVVGVLIEPVRNSFAHKARMMQLRAERCEEFLAAAMALQGAKTLFAMSLYGNHSILRPKDEEAVRQDFTKLIAVVDNVRRLASFVYLYGPDDLGEAALNVAEKAESIGANANPSAYSHEQWADRIATDAQAFRIAVDGFVKIARKRIEG